MKKLIILTGASGSGKSFLAKELEGKYSGEGKTVSIFSTDDYWVNSTGEYIFDRTRLGEAHCWNQDRCRDSMDWGVEIIIIDNTNILKKDYKVYEGLADIYGYHVELVEPTTPWRYDVDELVKRNVHGVPRETIEKMVASLLASKRENI